MPSIVTMADLSSRFLGVSLCTWAAATLFSPIVSSQSGHVPDPQDAREAGVEGSAEITFSGYQVLPGERGIIFVELTDPVTVEVSRSGQVIEYKLVGATVPLKNNRNPLLLRDFRSSAISAQLIPDRAQGKGKAKTKPAVRLVITLRGNVSPSHRMVTRGKGAALEVELPPPTSSDK
jgi:hypothetical protein